MAVKTYGERWETIESHDEGGQSYIFKVKDLKNPGLVYILKRLKNPKRLDRFKTELDAVQKLDHPRIVKVLDFGVYPAEPTKSFLVMEFFSGGTLGKHLQRFSNDPLAGLRLFMEICEAVAAAHQAGIIHRDLKPENILLRTPDGPPVVSDFGICFIDEGVRVTLTEEAVGPRLYIAPELEDGRVETVLPSSDVYSLGKILWSLMSGRTPFAREKHREQAYDLVAITKNDQMEHVNLMLDRMIVGDPSKRYANAGEVLQAVRRVIHLITYDYRVAAARAEHRCIYCGDGRYRLIAKRADIAIRNFGFQAVGNPDWRIFVCEQCGHVNMFRLDLGPQREKSGG